jgi:hypothetical protein
MSRRTTSVVALAATIVLATASLAHARPDTPSVACPEGGAELSLVVWSAATHDGSGATSIRRLKVMNDCAEFAFVWFASDPADGFVSSLLVAPGTTGTLTDTELAALGWDAENPTWQLWIYVDAGAVSDHAYCGFITGDQTVPDPLYELVGKGSLTPFSCS